MHVSGIRGCGWICLSGRAEVERKSGSGSVRVNCAEVASHGRRWLREALVWMQADVRAAAALCRGCRACLPAVELQQKKTRHYLRRCALPAMAWCRAACVMMTTVMMVASDEAAKVGRQGSV